MKNVTEEMVDAADSVLSRVRPGIPDETIRLAIAAALSLHQESGETLPPSSDVAGTTGTITVELHQKIVNELGRIIGDLQAELDKGKTP